MLYFCLLYFIFIVHLFELGLSKCHIIELVDMPLESPLDSNCILLVCVFGSAIYLLKKLSCLCCRASPVFYY